MYKISLITPVHQNLKGLKNIFNVVADIVGSDLEWIIKDSGSCEMTQAWLSEIDSPHIKHNSAPDSGLYDAMNAAIKIASAPYYLTLGSDDIIFQESIKQLISLSESSEFLAADIISFPVLKNKGLRTLHRYCPLSWNVSRLITSHSVGTIIRKRLHESLGYYDTRYMVLADSLFIKGAFNQGARFLSFELPVMGEFSAGGISSNENLVKIKESYDYNTATGSPIIIQAIFFLIRVARAKLKN
jgi:glycosyltransferase involved in cell wall biosynthesis